MKIKYLLIRFKKTFLIIPLFFLLINIPFHINRKMMILPDNNNFEKYAFVDDADQGNSVITDFDKNNEKLAFSYILKEGFSYPYTGIGLNFKNPKGINISKYKYVAIRYKAEHIKQLRIELKFYDDKLTDIENTVSYRYFVKRIPVSSECNLYKYKLSQFKTPEWWYTANNWNVDDGSLTKEYRKRFHSINFLSFNILENNIEDRVEVEYIAFEKDVITPLIISLSLLCISYLLLFLSFKFINEKTIDAFRRKLDVKNYKDVKEERIFEYINNNFNNPDISISSIKNETGIYEKHISKIIKDKSGLNFKQYLNKIRLDEAKRLLQETDRNITEIAFYVGYNNSSHFTRIFKQYFKISPKEFKNQK